MREYITLRDSCFVRERQSAAEALEWLREMREKHADSELEYRVVRETERNMRAGYVNTEDVTLEELIEEVEG